MASQPTKVAIRTYQVGFGDCFLLSFQYNRAGEKHVLIDFGTTKLPPKAPKSRMMDIAADIRKRTGGNLHAVVATHRHQDHISGFATAKGKGTGDVIKGLKPSYVVQPWTEDPNLAPDATGPGGKSTKKLTADHKHIASLAAMHDVARLAPAAPPPAPPDEPPPRKRASPRAPEASPRDAAGRAAAGLDRRSAEKLRRGELRLEARLDLHA